MDKMEQIVDVAFPFMVAIHFLTYFWRIRSNMAKNETNKIFNKKVAYSLLLILLILTVFIIFLLPDKGLETFSSILLAIKVILILAIISNIFYYLILKKTNT